MTTLVFLHAHPDDEVMTTGGTMARAAADGHRVVLVVATNGEHGEVPDDLAGESLVERRRGEVAASAAILGVARVAWLGYADSGMTGWDQNEAADSFWQADVDEAGARLAAILTEEDADVLVAYDWHGMYGHPDHVKVHRVGHRAAALAGTPTVFEATFNRDAMVAMAAEMGPDGPADFDPDGPSDDGNPFGEPASAIHLQVDVSPFVDLKRRAIACHASQATDTGMFLAMPEPAFAAAFSTEWFIRPGAPPGLRQGWLLDV